MVHHHHQRFDFDFFGVEFLLSDYMYLCQPHWWTSKILSTIRYLTSSHGHLHSHFVHRMRNVAEKPINCDILLFFSLHLDARSVCVHSSVHTSVSILMWASLWPPTTQTHTQPIWIDNRPKNVFALSNRKRRRKSMSEYLRPYKGIRLQYIISLTHVLLRNGTIETTHNKLDKQSYKKNNILRLMAAATYFYSKLTFPIQYI